ncbi:PREDICTED: piggyBac transposable element-derived protein 4-like [Eufriesea mexicana]|uniref:piggyBac transposable element-derived protein 4-like n=1 Tax=Eufriesea mexicana TaxID=516756 RepID=UPI00083BAC6A|nr:PREDICTED: piggyBac transposable element-derived protein 4-like [Eufriesea mexicana]
MGEGYTFVEQAMNTKKKITMTRSRSNTISDSDDSNKIVPVSRRKRLNILDTSSSEDSIPCNFTSSATCESISTDGIDEEENSVRLTEDIGPQSSLTNESKPINYFNLFIDSSLLTIMVCETNKYAEELIKSLDITRGSRMKQWKTVTLLEMKAFLSVLLEMGITKRPTMFSYWAENSRSIPWFSKMFSRNRFQLILRCFHLVDNKECFPPGHEKYDSSIKFMPIVEHANRVFKLYYKPHKELSIDESLVGTLCHSNMMQYMPNKKHHRWGIKFWMFCDVVSKYCLSFYCYKGAKEKSDTTKSREHGLGYEVVVNLLEQNQYLNKTNRKGVPSDIKTIKANEVKYARDGEVLLCGYRENKSVKKPVLLISTHASEDNTITIKKRNGNERSKVKPCIVDCYNRYMGGVDESDKMLYVYLDERRTVKYWKKVTFNVIARMVLNAYLLYKEARKEKLMTRLEFTSSIISEIEHEWMQVKQSEMISYKEGIYLA